MGPEDMGANSQLEVPPGHECFLYSVALTAPSVCDVIAGESKRGKANGRQIALPPAHRLFSRLRYQAKDEPTAITLPSTLLLSGLLDAPVMKS